MTDFSISNNSAQPKKDFKLDESVETGGVIASAATNTPSPLFTAVSTSSAETAGSIASVSSSSSSSGGFSANA